MATVAETLIVRIVADSAAARRDISDLERLLGRAGGGGGGLFGGSTEKAQILGTAVAGLTAGLAGFTNEAGKIEQVEVGFTTMLGSAEAARAKIAELQTFAARTPFSFEQVAKSAQTLLGMGASADSVIPIMQALGNAVSASGKGTEEFGRATLAVSQIISKGRLQGDELLQLAEAGVPLNEVLKELGVSYGEVGKQGVTAERAIAAIQKVMTSGRFAGAMENQSKTLFGSFSNLGDAVQRFGASLGQPLIGPVTAATKFLTGLIETLDRAPQIVKNIVTWLIVGLTGALAVQAARLTIASAKTAKYTFDLWANTVALNANTAAAQRNANLPIPGPAGGAAGGGAGAPKSGGFNPFALLPPVLVSLLVEQMLQQIRQALPGDEVGNRIKAAGDFIGSIQPGTIIREAMAGRNPNDATKDALGRIVSGQAPAAKQEEEKRKPEQTLAEKQLAATERLIAALEKQGLGIATSDVPGRVQAMIAREMAAAL